MALINLITVDLANKNVNLNSTNSGNLVENVFYNQSLNQITFSTRPDIVISGNDFLDLVNQVNIFQTAVMFNFSPNISVNFPFGSCENAEVHDSIGNIWGLTCIYGASPRLINYSGILSNKTIDLVARGNSKTIEFAEWLYFLPSLNHYKYSIRNYFSI